MSLLFVVFNLSIYRRVLIRVVSLFLICLSSVICFLFSFSFLLSVLMVDFDSIDVLNVW